MSLPVCAVMGAGPGLGKAIAAIFAKNKFAVALMCRSEASAQPAMEAIKAAGGEARFFSVDAESVDAIKSTFAQVVADLGPPEVLVYNTGGTTGTFGKGILDLDPAAVQALWQNQCLGALVAVQQVLPAMIENKKGTILLSSATAAVRGGKGFGAFAIAKHGVKGLSQSIAKEHAINGIHCVHIRLDCIIDGPRAKGYMGDKYNQDLLAKPDEIAETYWAMHCQKRSAWSNEIDIRPFSESWSC